MLAEMNSRTTPQPVSDDEVRWRALEARDASYDGAFVCAVRSTKIYCRPSCPSKRPRREGVRFFATPSMAEEAGYRACLRCHPRDATSSEVAMANKVCALLNAEDAGVPTLVELGAAIGVSPFHLQRTFKKVLGVTPRQYAVARRVELLKSGLRSDRSVTRALYDAGFGSSSRLYETAPDQLGMTPAAYRDGGRGMKITYTIRDCSLGRVLVAGTERGISAVSVSDGDAELEAALFGEYPAAEIERTDSVTRAWVDGVVSIIDEGAPHPELPLDVRASAFKIRVWQALREIPPGETRSYSEVARSIGNPAAVRAVARACATNPAALVIPCHRVIGADGTLTGYRWGLARKRTLLERERAARRGDGG
jgi:AraC family transcriptional regulator of adaptative response/methylated-DNA-[protein]-cysteine methyltransferase